MLNLKQIISRIVISFSAICFVCVCCCQGPLPDAFPFPKSIPVSKLYSSRHHFIYGSIGSLTDRGFSDFYVLTHESELFVYSGECRNLIALISLPFSSSSLLDSSHAIIKVPSDFKVNDWNLLFVWACSASNQALALLYTSKGDLLFSVDLSKMTDYCKIGGACLIADADGDGVPDIAVGLPGSPFSSKGQVVTISSTSGRLLGEISPPTFVEGANFGALVKTVSRFPFISVIGGIGGKRDNGVCVKESWTFFLYNGLDEFIAQDVVTILGFNDNRYTATVSSAGDFNSDGVQDFVVGLPTYLSPDCATFFYSFGAIFVVSGGCGSILRSYKNQYGRVFFGCSIASIGDHNGDGVFDFVVGSYAYASENIFGFGDSPVGYIDLISGASGVLLASVPAPVNAIEFGYSVVNQCGFFDVPKISVLSLIGSSQCRNSVRTFAVNDFIFSN